MSILNFKPGTYVHLKSTATRADGRIIPYATKQKDFEVSDVDESTGLVRIQSRNSKDQESFIVRAKDLENVDKY